MRFRLLSGRAGVRDKKLKFATLDEAKSYATGLWASDRVDWLSIYDVASGHIMPIFTEHDLPKRRCRKSAQDQRIDELVAQLQGVQNKTVSREMVRIFLFRESERL